MPSSSYLTQAQPHYQYQQTNSFAQIDIAYVGTTFIEELATKLYQKFNSNLDKFDNLNEFDKYLGKSSMIDIPGIILIEIDREPDGFKQVEAMRNNPLTSGAIIILLSKNDDEELKQKALDVKANDLYVHPFEPELIAERINFLIRFKLLKPEAGKNFNIKQLDYKMPLGKRLFDILVSSVALLLLSPLFALVAILIRLESKGPVIYKSKRAGTGYKIFDFYKFRSMVVDADKKLEKLSQTNNQYAADDKNAPKAFVKILNDPRITKIGAFLRKTSIDELPQLFNVLKGDMSLVGNRPLPLYEAEMLTSDQFAMRFLGPAGITGLWQISKRGKAEMSDTERKELDNQYAKYSSLGMDLKIILKTIPAMLQKEKV